MLIPRDYQVHTVAKTIKFLLEDTGHPLIALPTGTGKSLVIAELCKEIYRQIKSNAVIMKLTHVQELIEQNAEKLLMQWPQAPVGIYSAGLGQRDASQLITFAGIGSVHRNKNEFGHVDYVIIDEAHLVSPSNTTMYRSFFAYLFAINPNLRIIGLTATHYRMKQGSLTAEGGIFTDIVVDGTGREAFNWFIDQGYLTQLVPRPTVTELDTSQVQTTNTGEYNLKQLQETVDQTDTNESAIREILTKGEGRRKWLVFAAGVEHALHLTEVLNDYGVSTTCVHGKLKKYDRQKRLAMHKEGKFTAMVNNNVLTTGYDDAGIDLIPLLRPTRSPGLWVQMLGRGTRPLYAPGYDLNTAEGRLAAIANGGKPNCLVLDFAGNTVRLGPINDPILPQARGKGGGAAPVKECPNCQTLHHTMTLVCYVCQYEFPPPDRTRELEEEASEAELVVRHKNVRIIEDFRVDRVVYEKHKPYNKPPSLKVTYHCRNRRITEYIQFEHPGYNKGKRWWKEHAFLRNQSVVPETIDEVLQRVQVLRVPVEIKVWVNRGSYPEIMSTIFQDELEESI